MTQTQVHPPADGMTDEEEKKRRNRRVITGLIIGIVVLAVFGCGLLGWFLRNLPEYIGGDVAEMVRNLENNKQEVMDSLHIYFSDLRDGNIETAFQQTRQGMFGTQTLDEFTQIVREENYPKYDSYLGVYVQSIHVSDEGNLIDNDEVDIVASFTAVVLSEGNQYEQISGEMVFYEGSWLVERISILPDMVEVFEGINEQ